MFKIKKTLLYSAATVLLLGLFTSTAFAYSGAGKVQCNGSLNVRKSYTTHSAVITKLKSGTKVSIVKSQSGWYEISLGKTLGWVSSQYVSTGSGAKKASGTSSAQKIACYAEQFAGVRYVHGGSSPSGFDCSGLTKYVYSKFGVDLAHSAVTQSHTGKSVSRSNLQAGDLVFFDTNGGHNSVSHVGMYIGNGKFISAETGHVYKVTIRSLNDSYWSPKFMCARRYV